MSKRTKYEYDIPRNEEEANSELQLAEEVLGDASGRFHVQDGITRTETRRRKGHDRTRVYIGGKWVSRRAESYIQAAHEIAPPPPNRSEPLPPDPYPGRRWEPDRNGELVPPRGINVEMGEAVSRYAICREQMVIALRGGRPNDV